jgi:hypothetical protein
MFDKLDETDRFSYINELWTLIKDLEGNYEE